MPTDEITAVSSDWHDNLGYTRQPSANSAIGRNIKPNFTLILAVFTVCLTVIILTQFSIVSISNVDISKSMDFTNSINSYEVIKHVENLISIGNSEFVYENSRAKAREYIRDSLNRHGIPLEQILWHRFEWTERKAHGRNITTTTWTGINIVVWSNSTEVPIGYDQPKLRIMGAHYDTVNWGENRTAGAHDNLAGTALLIELASKIYHHQQRCKERGEQEIPYLFIFFDHEEPGAFGSKTFVDYYKIAKLAPHIAYFIDIDSIGYRGASPMLQTYPYEDKGQTYYSPRWLASLMIQASFMVTEEGMNIGNQNILHSIGHQAFRYHLMSIPFLSDDGPFTWSGVPSLLFTDLDIFFEGNPDYHKITDQLQNLDEDVLEKAGNILLYFTLATEEPTLISTSKPLGASNIVLRLLSSLASNLQRVLIPGSSQYIIVGPYSFGFIELASIGFFQLLLIHQISFKAYRAISLEFLVKDEYKRFTVAQYLNHRLLFFHLFLLFIALCQDTVFAFMIISLGFPALISLHKKQINLITSFLSCILCVNFMVLDILSMDQFGRRGSRSNEIKLGFLLITYGAHSLLVLVYGWDYSIKSKLKFKKE